MEKKPMMYAQRTLDFETPANAETTHVAELTSEPPPADQSRDDSAVVRPTGNSPMAETPHYEWPDATPLARPGHPHRRPHPRRHRTAPRIASSSSEVIRCEVFFSAQRTSIGEVVRHLATPIKKFACGFQECTEGFWFSKRPNLLPPLNQSRCDPERVNTSLASSQRSTTSTEHPLPRQIVFRPPAKGGPNHLYTFNRTSGFSPASFRRAASRLTSIGEEFLRLLRSQNPLQAELKTRFKAKELVVLAQRMGYWHANGSTKDENGSFYFPQHARIVCPRRHGCLFRWVNGTRTLSKRRSWPSPPESTPASLEKRQEASFEARKGS